MVTHFESGALGHPSSLLFRERYSQPGIAQRRFQGGASLYLDQLDATMDQLVISGLKVNAILELVPKVIDTALAIGNSVTAHTGQS